MTRAPTSPTSDPRESHLGGEESVADTAHVLGTFYDGIEFRGFDQAPLWRSSRERRGSLYGTVPPTSGIPPRCSLTS